MKADGGRIETARDDFGERFTHEAIGKQVFEP
jgi:hypothetical protein